VNFQKMETAEMDSMWDAFKRPTEIMEVQGDTLDRLDVAALKYAEDLKEQ
jgi:hypothetical protein